ncbi:MAG: outer membrane beta-barrel protein [Acidobacteria bacterium]|nr:outer membrane beta-barrel protein [Acidobacteriota bacterium]
MNKLPPPTLFLILLAGLGAVAQAQNVEVGGMALATAYRNAGVKAGPSVGNVGFQPGPSFGGFLGQNMGNHFGGEIRYLYAQNDLKLSSGGAQTTFAGRSHIINYDLMIYAAPRRARVRPYAAGGGGLKFYQGTGAEQAFQPLSNLALLTKTNETLPTVDFGGGVKFYLSHRTAIRVEFRDYITKVPKVFAASPGARISGVLHQWVPAFGISWTF